MADMRFSPHSLLFESRLQKAFGGYTSSRLNQDTFRQVNSRQMNMKSWIYLQPHDVAELKHARRNCDSLGTEVLVGVDLIAQMENAIGLTRHPCEPVPQAQLLRMRVAIAAHTGNPQPRDGIRGRGRRGNRLEDNFGGQNLRRIEMEHITSSGENLWRQQNH